MRKLVMVSSEKVFCTKIKSNTGEMLIGSRDLGTEEVLF